MDELVGSGEVLNILREEFDIDIVLDRLEIDIELEFIPVFRLQVKAIGRAYYTEFPPHFPRHSLDRISAEGRHADKYF